MAAYDFPATAGKPTDGSFTYTAPTGELYEWNGYSWVTPGSPAGEDPNLRFVNITGDTMTGNLTLPGGGSDTEALQKQEIEALPVSTFNNDSGYITLGEVPAPDLTPYVEKAGDNMTGDLTLGTDKITLNTDGSATFGGSVVSSTGGSNASVYPQGQFWAITDDSVATPSIAVRQETIPAGGGQTFGVYSDGTLNIGPNIQKNQAGDPINATIQLNSDGSAKMAGAKFAFETDGSMSTYAQSTSSFFSCLSVHSNIPTHDTKKFRVRADGAIEATNTTVQAIASERRLKENIVAIESVEAWETIKLTPYYAYNFIGSDSINYGPMADEVPAEMVVQPMEEDEAGVMVARSDDEGPIRSYDNGMLQARLYTALQTALTRIEALEAKVTSLEGGNN